MRWYLAMMVVFIMCLMQVDSMAQPSENAKRNPQVADSSAEKLVVLWTSGDAEVAKKMVFMYVYNAKKYEWWDEITFIIWGPSSKLLAEDEELQKEIGKMKQEGIVLEACKACADQYGVSEKLKSLGVDVKYMGKPLTEYIKGKEYVVTF